MTSDAIPSVDLVVPCYNEEEVLPETFKRLSEVRRGLIDAGKINDRSKIYYIDDGSRDRTWSLIHEASESDPSIIGVKLSRNHGTQATLLAGIHASKGDAVVTVDADLQDDVNAIGEMVDHFRAGCEVVYGVRRKRERDTFLKRTTARAYYRLMLLMGVQIIYDHSDYRLMSRTVLDVLVTYPERNFFIRGIIPTIGFNTAMVYYDRSERFAGQTKYNYWSLTRLAVNSIAAFSTKPLQWVSIIGLVTFVCSLAFSIWVLIQRFTGTAVPGWASTLLPLLLLGGAQIMCLGVIGSYIGRIYHEVTRRPRFIVEQVTDGSETTDQA